jgi:hypothetical protein
MIIKRNAILLPTFGSNHLSNFSIGLTHEDGIKDHDLKPPDSG